MGSTFFSTLERARKKDNKDESRRKAFFTSLILPSPLYPPLSKACYAGEGGYSYCWAMHDSCMTSMELFRINCGKCLRFWTL